MVDVTHFRLIVTAVFNLVKYFHKTSLLIVNSARWQQKCASTNHECQFFRVYYLTAHSYKLEDLNISFFINLWFSILIQSSIRYAIYLTQKRLVQNWGYTNTTVDSLKYQKQSSQSPAFVAKTLSRKTVENSDNKVWIWLSLTSQPTGLKK